MEFAVRFDEGWECSRHFGVTRREAMFKVSVAKKDRRAMNKILVVEYIRSPTEVEGIAIVNITVTAPFVLQNITPYSLSFEFPMLKNGGGGGGGGIIRPNSSQSFYFDTGTKQPPFVVGRELVTEILGICTRIDPDCNVTSGRLRCLAKTNFN